MAVTHSPSGFTGTVDQIDEARRLAITGGGRFRVNGSADWAITANSGTNRTVNIATGSAAACGVLDATTATDSVTFAANAGGSDRFDAVVATFDWSAMTITFRVIQGTTVPPVIVRTGTTVDTTKINWLPGLRYDAVLGIIRARPSVAILAPADLYDCRPWGVWHTLNVFSAAFKDQIDIDPNGRIRETAGANARVEFVKQIDGTWRTGVSEIMSSRSMTVERSTATPTDNYSAVRTSLMAGTWVDAPAGDYLVTATVAVQAAGGTVGSAEVFILVNGTTITKPGTRADVPVTINNVMTYIRPYRHTGGNLTASVDHFPNIGTTVNNATTQFVVAYLGPVG